MSHTNDVVHDALAGRNGGCLRRKPPNRQVLRSSTSNCSVSPW